MLNHGNSINLSDLPSAPKFVCPRGRNGYDEEAAYDSCMNPKRDFQSGPGDPVDADYMAPCLLRYDSRNIGKN